MLLITRSHATTIVVVVACLVVVAFDVVTAFPQPKASFGGGAGVGRFVLDQDAVKFQTHYDMILVERLQNRKSPQDVEEGDLYVPDEDLPRLHLCRVISKGPGREEENGMVAPDINNIQPGDLIIAKDPWGIGPKDEELSDGTKLSYMREQNIAAKLSGDLLKGQVDELMKTD